MKNITLLSLVVAALLFTACDEKTKEAVSDAASAVTESAKEATSDAVDATKDAASSVVEATKEKAAEAAASATKAAEATKAKAADAAQALKDRATAATEAAKETVANATGSVDLEAGKAAYAKCVGCHGADGKTKALGKANPIAGQSAQEIAQALREYKAGTKNVSGMGMLMKGQVASMDDATIEALAAYIASL